jgi:hypothetical protein
VPRHLIRQAALADARLARHEEQAAAPGEGALHRGVQIAQLLAPPHEGVRARGRLRCCPVRSVERRVLVEDRLLELAKRPARVQAQLEELVPGSPVGLERLGLAVRAVEREHELPGQALAHRVVGHQPLELGHQLPMAPQLQVRLDALLQRGDAELLQPGDLGARERLELQAAEWRTAPQRQGIPELPRCPGRITVGAGALAPRQHLLEVTQVQPGRPNDVPRWLGEEDTRVQRLAQLGDVDLQCLLRRGRRFLAHSPSISRSEETTSPAWSSSSASSARGLAAPRVSGRPSLSTSSGPRIRKSISSLRRLNVHQTRER